MFLLTILKELLTLYYKKKCEAELRNLFLSEFSMAKTYMSIGGIRDPLKQDLALQFCRKQNKGVIISTETHINLDQICHIRNNWFGPIFFSPGDSRTKGLLVLLHLGLEGVTKHDTDPKERFASFMVTHSNDRVLCAYSRSGHSTGNSWLGGVSLKDYKIPWKNNTIFIKRSPSKN